MKCVGSNEPRSHSSRGAPANRINGNFKTHATIWCASMTCLPAAVVASVSTFPAHSPLFLSETHQWHLHAGDERRVIAFQLFAFSFTRDLFNPSLPQHTPLSPPTP